MQRTWLRVALLNLFLAAGMGALLRFAFVEEIGWVNFKYFLHAHSHVAILGWAYMALYAFLIHTFLPKEKHRSKFYNYLFWLTQLSVLGMLVSFPIQGYGGWSIVFSSAHIFLSYVFFWRFWKDLRAYPNPDSHSPTKANQNRRNSLSRDFRLEKEPVFSIRFIRAGLLFMVLSTVAIWAMTPIIAMQMKRTAFYYASVQFYLHFQFNGWFIFTVLGLFFKVLENHHIALPPKLTNTFFKLLVISCFFTYALAVTWSTPLPYLFLLNSTGVCIQFGALCVFLIIMRRIWAKTKPVFKPAERFLLWISFLSFVFKILIQTAVVIPYIATVAYTIRNYSIGFLHLMLLGMVSCFLIVFGAHRGLFNLHSKWARAGIGLFIGGFILSEIILFVQGTMFWASMGFLPDYYEVLFGVSVLLPLGIGFLWFGQRVRFR